ncbi:unnamed protein product [Chrysoparadoxa australica]
MSDVGFHVRIYSYRYDSWYEATIMGFDKKTNMHRCRYVLTGECLWQDLLGGSKQVEVVTGGRASSSQVTAKVSSGVARPATASAHVRAVQTSLAQGKDEREPPKKQPVVWAPKG